MRSALLAIVSVATLSVLSAACGDASSSTGAIRRGSGHAPAPGTAEEHDDGDEGDQSVDTGNPNADGSPSAPSSAGQASGEIAVTLSNTTPAADLGTKVEIDVTVEPKGGFTGDVDLSVAGLPDGASGTFNPIKLTLGAAAQTAKLTLDVPVTTVCSAPGQSSALVVTAKSATDGSITATGNANFKVNPKMLLTIPMNIDALRAAGGVKYIDQWGEAFGTNQQALRTQAGNGIVVTVKNGDSKPHVVHGNNGFAHGDSGNPIPANSIEMQNGSPRLRTLNVGVDSNGYMHEGGNGPSVSFRIKVASAP